MKQSKIKIIVKGGIASGKSTIIALIADLLNKEGFRSVDVKEINYGNSNIDKTKRLEHIKTLNREIIIIEKMSKHNK